MSDISKEAFCSRFVIHMVNNAGFENFICGGSVKEYAEATAPTYYDEQYKNDGESPEECAEADMSYWENE